jgi:hypothetical protein
VENPRPARSPAADPIQIALAGRDVITVKGQKFPLDCYTVANPTFGREILWMNAEGDLVAAMTFAGGLPALYSWEAVRTEYESALPQLYRSGLARKMAHLAEIGRHVRADRTGVFAITGARLVDGTGATHGLLRLGVGTGRSRTRASGEQLAPVG